MIDSPRQPEQLNRNRTDSRLVTLALVLLITLGAVFRLTGVNWDEDQHLHPDERFLTMVESSIRLPGFAFGPAPQGCAKWGQYFNTPCSPLNPYNHNFGLFVYGTFPIFLTQFVGQLLSMTDYGHIHLVGRVLSAIFDLATVPLIFFIGRRLYGTRVALLGALFLTASVLDIQQSHFFTVDTFTNVPILLAFWFALDIAEGKSRGAYVLAGIMFGLALAGRINIAPFAVVLIAAALLRAYLRSQSATSAGRSFAVASARAFVALAVCAAAALVTFRLAQPYAANGPNFISTTLPRFDLQRGGAAFLFDVALSWAGGVNPRFADNMAYVSELVAGRIDYPPGHQWTDRTPYLFPLQNMVLWGLGLPLGIAAWAGFALASYRLVRQREWQHLLVVIWVALTFGYSGQQFAKTMRYFLQIYPFLCLLGGFFIVFLWERASRVTSYRFIARAITAFAAFTVIGYTIFWAAAFTSIYTRPVSRVAASRWMFENIPQGSVLANEHWDDPLPLRVDGKDPFGGMYRNLRSSQDGLMQWYAEDTPEKRVQAINWINEAQYIILSSNRLYGSIPRLPMRYPMTTKYYEWLFDGTLDFELAATFTSRPQMFGIEINDDDAEEIFTVYDHPKVLIFKKSPRYNPSKTAALFNSIDLNEVYRLWPLQATQAKNALLLSESDRTAQRSGGTWREIFDPSNLVNRAPVLVWLAVTQVLGWLAFPFAFVILRGLTDRGYVFAKALGLLVPAWAVWMLASIRLAPFSRESSLLVGAFFAIISSVILWVQRREILAFVRAQRVTILVQELLFLLFFAIFLAIRFGNPDLWHPNFGGEKPMDFAYLNAIVKSTWMPPYDPWFAGGYINYYYFGQFITAMLLKLSGIVPEVAYNLALSTFFALTAMGAFSLVFNLVSHPPSVVGQRPLARFFIFAFLGAIFVAVIGNLGELVLIIDTFTKIGERARFDLPILGSALNMFVGILQVVTFQERFEIPAGWWYWNATRVIPDTINEFPFFTFLYADLHAHLIALPFTLLVLALAVNFILRDSNPRKSRWGIAPIDVAEVIFIALALGSLRAINFADFSTYVLIVLGALTIGEYGRRRRVSARGLYAVGWRFAAIYALTSVIYQPFVQNFATAYLATDLWTDKRTRLGEYLVVHGIFLFGIAAFLLAQSFRTKQDRGAFRLLALMIRRAARLERALALHRALAQPLAPFQEFSGIVVAGAIVVEILFVLAGWWVFALVLPLLTLAGLLILRPDLDPRARFLALLIAAGLALTLMVELVTYKGDIGRMNTVFKFYLQVWVFLGIASAAGIAFLSRQKSAVSLHSPSRSRRLSLGTLWWTFFGLLIIAGMLYPVFATRAKIADRFVREMPPGLNGMDYMEQAVYHDRDRPLPLVFDRQAIEWLRENIDGSPVILEGNAPLYHWGSRVSIYTGLPTVIGWDWHQKQQRSIVDGVIIDRRIETVREIYNTTDIQRALIQLKRFDVKYIYLGDMERAFYDAQGLAKFDGMAHAGILEIVYQNERVKIYRLKV